MDNGRTTTGLLAALTAGATLLLSSCDVFSPAPPAADYIGPILAASPTTAPTTQPATAPARPAVAPDGPLAVTVQEAILLSLERNQSLRVERLNPAIARTYEQQERAVFDPTLSLEASASRERKPRTGGRTTEKAAGAEAAVTQLLPTGTDISAGITSDYSTTGLHDDRYVNRLGLSVNQALLRGAGLDVNLASVRQARIDTLISEYELRGFAEALVAQTEETYWDYALAQRTIEIVTNSLKLAQQQRDEIRERINVGRLAETELAAAEAEVALRRENLINARSDLAKTRLRLLRLLNPTEADFWNREVVLKSVPGAPQIELDKVEVYVAVALRMRPELNQARLGVQRGDLELVKTRNGLLPKLDVFLTLGKSGYANSFGDSFANIAREDYDALAGLRLEYPPGNRDAEAKHQRAIWSREQALRAVENLVQLAQVDVRSAYVEVDRAREQVAATAATRRLQEEALRAETEKFRVGKSTSFLVAQAQRDLLESQIGEVRAVVSFLKALIGLHLQEGALLERRGISAPGATPVDLSAPRRW
ncbi:MAG TPA: TolC family protein [Phycisphaerales bacterium]|nr:TolC family protein [Phycisphaerales bacterium]